MFAVWHGKFKAAGTQYHYQKSGKSSFSLRPFLI
jgi:hypothetical protein